MSFLFETVAMKNQGRAGLAEIAFNAHEMRAIQSYISTIKPDSQYTDSLRSKALQSHERQRHLGREHKSTAIKAKTISLR